MVGRRGLYFLAPATSNVQGPSNPFAPSNALSSCAILLQTASRSASVKPAIIWCSAANDSRPKRTHSALEVRRTGAATRYVTTSRKPAIRNASSRTPGASAVASLRRTVCLICAALASGKTRRLVGRYSQSKLVVLENLSLRGQWRGGILTPRSERVVLSHAGGFSNPFSTTHAATCERAVKPSLNRILVICVSTVR